MLIDKPNKNDRARIEYLISRLERSNVKHPALIADRDADLAELRAMLAACPTAEELAMEKEIQAERTAFDGAQRAAYAAERAEVRSAFRR